MVALFYDWWNIFVRLIEPDRHMEAITSRPLLLHAIATLSPFFCASWQRMRSS
jgi:hypothetical protein